jgi:protein-S-isoprenylcysteine O-methyltransferase Ste14
MVLLLKNLLFTVVVPGTVAVLLPLAIAAERTAVATPPRALALLLFAAGGSIYAWCVWDFASFGRGTPAPIDAPKRLVVRGLYRYVRNPMYLGVLTFILGWAAWCGSTGLLLYAAAVATLFHTFIVLYEEPHLRREFGDEYVRYCARAWRWLPRAPKP